MNDSSLPVVIYGPQGCGKTCRARELMELFGCELLVDGWDGRPLPRRALALTNMDAAAVASNLGPGEAGVVMPFDLAIHAMAGLRAECALVGPEPMEGAA